MAEDSMTQGGQAILSELQAGDNIAVPTVYPHSLVFSDHARLYLENARDLCGAGKTDFAIFGALYCIRHGLELWLKCFLRNFHIDKFLWGVAAQPEADLKELVELLEVDSLGEYSVRRIVCAMRNVLVDRITAPECWQKRTEPEWADKGLDFMRHNGARRRQRFASLWTESGSYSHDLLEIWNDEAEIEMRGFRSRARSSASDLVDGMTAPERVEDICGFFAHFDKDGDAFRYPISRDDKWRFDLPKLSLTALADLAEELARSVTDYRAFRQQVYDLGTLANPRAEHRI